MARTKRDLTRITINLPSHLLEMIDEYAKNVGLSRTTAIMIFCADGLGEYKRQRDDQHEQSTLSEAITHRVTGVIGAAAPERRTDGTKVPVGVRQCLLPYSKVRCFYNMRFYYDYFC